MQISSLSTVTFQIAGGTQKINKMKKSFDELGSALESGDLTTAKNLLTEIQKNAPAQGGGNNPRSQKLDTLSKAIESGDVKAAQQAYTDIKKTAMQRPNMGGSMPQQALGASGGGQKAGGAPPSGGVKPSGASSSSGSSSSSSTKTYDKKDANEDGTVSTMEEIQYDLEHPPEEEEDSNNGFIDVKA